MSSTSGEIRAEFIPGAAGQLFMITRLPAKAGSGAARGRVLLVPPFGEELAKSRRMLRLQAEALTGLGFAVGLVDLYGTGDSAGEFADGRWELWLRDLDAAADSLAAAAPASAEGLIYVGLRMGALLALEHAARASGSPGRLVLWQPWLDGRSELDALLKVRVLADKFVAGIAGASVSGLRAALDAGETIEIGGYALSPALAAEIDARRIEPLIEGSVTGIDWLDIGPGEAPTPRRASVLDSLPRERLNFEAIRGSGFWSTAEITTCPALIEATSRAIAA